MPAKFTKRVWTALIQWNLAIISQKTTKRIRGAVTLLSKDCTRTSITDLQRYDSVLWSRAFFMGILGPENGLRQGNGWLPAASRLGWRLRCIILYGDAVYSYKASSRSRHDELSSGWWHGLKMFFGSDSQRLVLMVRKELVTLGILLSRQSINFLYYCLWIPDGSRHGIQGAPDSAFAQNWDFLAGVNAMHKIASIALIKTPRWSVPRAKKYPIVGIRKFVWRMLYLESESSPCSP